jgi:hypothetical protein
MLSGAKNLSLRPFAALRVTREGANLVWSDLGSPFYERRYNTAHRLRHKYSRVVDDD